MFEEFIGTKAVSARHQFDVAALDAYLRQHVAGYPSGPLDHRPGNAAMVSHRPRSVAFATF